MVKYKFIGKTNYQCGKTLWEIIGNLKDYGVGRLVTKGVFLSYSEPSFYRIIKAEACPLTEVVSTAYYYLRYSFDVNN